MGFFFFFFFECHVKRHWQQRVPRTHCLLGRIMEKFAIANPSRASLAGIEMPPRGHRVEVRLCHPPLNGLLFLKVKYYHIIFLTYILYPMMHLRYCYYYNYYYYCNYYYHYYYYCYYYHYYYLLLLLLFLLSSLLLQYMVRSLYSNFHTSIITDSYQTPFLKLVHISCIFFLLFLRTIFIMFLELTSEIPHHT